MPLAPHQVRGSKASGSSIGGSLAVALILFGSVADSSRATPQAAAKSIAAPSASGDLVALPSFAINPTRLQLLLARAHFSPGLIDGKPGRKTKIALEHLQRARDLPVTGVADAATLASLGSTDPLAKQYLAQNLALNGAPDQTPVAWTTGYRITQADVEQITGPIPEDWNERAMLSLSGYADMADLLAERGWCSPEILAQLNPGIDLALLVEGDSVVLPDVPQAAGKAARPLPKAALLQVELGEKLVTGLDATGKLLFLMHCSIARELDKRPLGELKVKVIATDPEYLFDPKDWPEVSNVVSKLRIAPGPRNPVGSAWIGLDKPGFGLHGTVRPRDIGKTGSHGCFRLTNWDARRLAFAVKAGTPVVVKP